MNTVQKVVENIEEWFEEDLPFGHAPILADVVSAPWIRELEEIRRLLLDTSISKNDRIARAVKKIDRALRDQESDS